MALLDVKPYDREFYETKLKDFLPDTFIDCHAHIWHDRFCVFEDTKHRSQLWPMMVAKDNPIEDLEETNKELFPGKRVLSALYSHTHISVDLRQANPYVAECARRYGYPALYVSHPSQSAEEVEREVQADPVFKGLKVYLEYAPSYIPNNEIRIYDFLPPRHLALANKHKWVVQLHIPRPGRLADPVNYIQLGEIEEKYPDLQLLVAHLGRAYADEDVGNALEYLKDTRKTVWDFTANTNENVIRQVLEHFGPERLIYGSDFPIFRMKARRVVENAFYINEIPEGSLGGAAEKDAHLREIPYPEAEKITFFIYEEIDSCRRACERLGLTKTDVEKIFYSNSAKIFGMSPS